MTLTTALVLAGGSLSGKRIGPSPPLSAHPACLADGSGLALDRIAARLSNLPGLDALQVVIDAPMPSLRPMRQRRPWQWRPIAPQPSVLASLEAALQQGASPQVLVLPVTTLPPDTLPAGHWIGLSEEALPREDWSAVLEPRSSQPRFLSKHTPADAAEPRSHAFTGLIAAPTDLLLELLARRGSSKDWTLQADQDLLTLAEQLWHSGACRLELMPWLDLGHRATASRRRLSRLSSRGFNRVTYCPARDVICKHSSDRRRLVQEAAYYQALPQPLQRFFPACLSLSDSGLELETIPFPSLAELFLHWRIGANAWRQILRRLATAQHALASEDAPDPPPVASPQWLYSSKLQDRLQRLQAAPPELGAGAGAIWEQWWHQPWTLALANRTLQLPAPATAAASLLDTLPALETPCPLVRIHGDLCFNNILAEPLSGAIRLIDPRGERPAAAHWPIGFGDPRYDLVKLLHSGRYLYDAVVNDLFDLRMLGPGHLHLQLDVPDHYPMVNAAIDELVLQGRLNDDDERLLSASLFFSMLPLHREDGERCLVFTAIGLLILQRCFDALLPPSMRRSLHHP